MVLYEVFSHSIKKRYKTSIFTKASIIQLLSIVLTYLSPFLIAYFTGGFWIKEKAFTETPDIKFQYRYIAILEGESNLYISSSYESINQIYQNEYRSSVRIINELDTDDDGFPDLLEFNLLISGVPIDTITNVKLMLLFNSTISVISNLKLESVGFFESYNSRKYTELSFDAELAFVQREKLREQVTYNGYSYQMLNETNIDLEELNLDKIIRDYSSREFSTRLVTDYVSWKNSLAEGFKINAYIRYVPFKLDYIPAFWQQFKWGWIQYISILIPFIFVFRTIKVFIFENQLVPTICVNTSQKMKTS
ncbi:transmembrane protein -like [Brachionus plicatilis]|uniref:Transmembrane protein 231 n=1 Tax=Brachionus plicatilis TaxID=10195 RepID=A0A3M7RPV6_BRAPC|nr:transmembrane protein -like [Brachionus plicatilis]